jgi:hypothetical protein
MAYSYSAPHALSFKKKICVATILLTRYTVCGHFGMVGVSMRDLGHDSFLIYVMSMLR